MNLEDAVNSLKLALVGIMLEDAKNILERQTKSHSAVAAPVNRENSAFARGVTVPLFEFTTPNNELDYFAPQRHCIFHHDTLLNIADSRFPRVLSDNLNLDPERGRAVIRIKQGKRHGYYFAADAIFRNDRILAQQQLTHLFGDQLSVLQRMPTDAEKKMYLDAGYTDIPPALDLREVYRRLLSLDDATASLPGTRTYNALMLGLSLQSYRRERQYEKEFPPRILMARVTVPAQPPYDIDEIITSKLREEEQTIKRSKLGTGEIYIFGDKGLLSKISLRVDEEADPDYQVLQVPKDNTWQEMMGVVCRETYYVFDKERLQVMEKQNSENQPNPEYILPSEIPSLELKERA